jgi:hypothetical protein
MPDILELRTLTPVTGVWEGQLGGTFAGTYSHDLSMLNGAWAQLNSGQTWVEVRSPEPPFGEQLEFEIPAAQATPSPGTWELTVDLWYAFDMTCEGPESCFAQEGNSRFTTPFELLPGAPQVDGGPTPDGGPTDAGSSGDGG